jgi:hypothetical protein
MTINAIIRRTPQIYVGTKKRRIQAKLQNTSVGNKYPRNPGKSRKLCPQTTQRTHSVL